MLPENLYGLPLEQQIGQFLFIGLPGTELDADTRALIEEVQPGGIIIFGRNVASPEQLRSLLDGVRELVRTPPLFGIDQEGGLVDRLRRIFTPMPAARTIRQHGDLAASRALGRITGEVLRMLGFNLNFAPVMSIMTEDRDLLVERSLFTVVWEISRRSSRLHNGLHARPPGHRNGRLPEALSRDRRRRS